MKSQQNNIPELERLEKNEISKAEDCLIDAFSNDPSFKYLLQSDNYLPEKARPIHEYTLKYGLKAGYVYKTSSNIEGICIWLPPKTNNHSALMHAWNFILCGGLKMNKSVNPKTIETMKKYGEYSSKLHHKHAKGPHWYLMSIGIAKEHQGKGLSKKLVFPMLNYLDKNKQSCYLETHLVTNVTFYEKHGFKIMEVGKLPGTDKNHWAMLRKPQI